MKILTTGFAPFAGGRRAKVRRCGGPDLWKFGKKLSFWRFIRYNRKAHDPIRPCKRSFYLGGLFLKHSTKTLLCVLCAAAAALCVIFAIFMLTKKQSASSASSAAASSSAASSAPAVSEYGTVDSFDYQNFTYSDGLDANGYRTGITAQDYVTLPDNVAALPIKKADVTPSDSDVQARIDSLLSQYSTTQAVTDRAAQNGDEEIAKLVETAITALAAALKSVIYTLDPGKLVLYGRMFENPYYLTKLMAEMREGVDSRHNVPIEKSRYNQTLENSAAGLLMVEKFFELGGLM